MRVHVLEREQRIAAPPAEVFPWLLEEDKVLSTWALELTRA